MTDDKTRAEFEELIKSSPFEHMCDRNGDNSAWPGHYKRYETQLAWDVWQAAKERYCADKSTIEKRERLEKIASGAARFAEQAIVKKYPSTAAEHIRGLSKIVLDPIKEN